MSSSISVAVRVRPFSQQEKAMLPPEHASGPTLFQVEGASPSTSAAVPAAATPHSRLLSSNYSTIRKIVKVLDDRILVFDPPDPDNNTAAHKAIFPQYASKKEKDIRFCFDRVFDEDATQAQVYAGTAKELIGHVMDGFHSTVFAYGATGCGKTHTISGTKSDPGIIFLLMRDLFERIADKSSDVDFQLSISYLEIYNETIKDLLAPEKGVLPLRENKGVAEVSGLTQNEPASAQEVVELITCGNSNRTVNATDANATSSRSHAVLRVTVTQRPRGEGLQMSQASATLSIIDLAGSERASATRNRGDRLHEGANINKSLLALGNCINALCDPRRNARGHIPFRDSKLTRLLKPSLGGNCKTVMIVCVSPSSGHYDETHNTLQYGNRAKEIKTKAIRNVINVDRHVAQYCQQILEQKDVITRLRADAVASKAQMEQLKGKVDRLESELATARSTGGNTLDTSRVSEFEQEAADLIRLRLAGPYKNAKERLVLSERATVEKDLLSMMLSHLSGHAELTESLTSRKNKLESQIVGRDLCLMQFEQAKASVLASAAANPLTTVSVHREILMMEMQLELECHCARRDGLAEAYRLKEKVAKELGNALIDRLLSCVGESVDDEGKATISHLKNTNDAFYDAMHGAFAEKALQVVTEAPAYSPDRALPELSHMNVEFESSTSSMPQNVLTPSLNRASPRRVKKASTMGSARRISRSPKKIMRLNSIQRSGTKKKKEVQWRDIATQDHLEEVLSSATKGPSGTKGLSLRTQPQKRVMSCLLKTNAEMAENAVKEEQTDESDWQPLSSARSPLGEIENISSEDSVGTPLVGKSLNTMPMELVPEQEVSVPRRRSMKSRRLSGGTGGVHRRLSMNIGRGLPSSTLPPRKSPRKILSHGALSSAAKLGAPSATAPSAVFGLHSASRAAARRESTVAQPVSHSTRDLARKMSKEAVGNSRTWR